MKNKETTMTLDSPSKTGRPGLDELVPSRYAMKVGEIDGLGISDGVLSLPSPMLGHNTDPAVRAAWLNDIFLSTDILEWARNVCVLRCVARAVAPVAGSGGAVPDPSR